jgi:hypothetical protein
MASKNFLFNQTDLELVKETDTLYLGSQGHLGGGDGNKIYTFAVLK